MAFNKEPTDKSFNNDEKNWKAQAFLNLYLPTKEGKRRKLGAIPLRDNKPKEAELRAWIGRSPEHAIKVLLNLLVIEYQEVEESEASSFDLPNDAEMVLSAMEETNRMMQETII